MTSLKDLPNIGSKIEKHLHAIGVQSLADLKKMGSLEAWKRIRALDPKKDCCICALYALEGAIVGLCWYELPEGMKNKLKKAAEGI